MKTVTIADFLRLQRKIYSQIQCNVANADIFCYFIFAYNFNVMFYRF